jgi:hypothetical protein
MKDEGIFDPKQFDIFHWQPPPLTITTFLTMTLHAVLRAAARLSHSQHASRRLHFHLPAASLLLVTIAGCWEVLHDEEQDGGGGSGTNRDDEDVRNVGNRFWFLRRSSALCQQLQLQQKQQTNEKVDDDTARSHTSSRNDYSSSGTHHHPYSQPQQHPSLVSAPFHNFVATSSAYLDLRIQRALTSKRMAAEKSRRTFFSVYEVQFNDPLGSGAYGDVYLCRERSTGEECALKKIPKEFTDRDEFQREMNTLLHIRANGGHPNICMLRENFDEEDDYMLVFDLVDGGEMFEHLIKHGAYSEADASRLLRQVASALDFIHGIGVVHAGTSSHYYL